MYKTRPMRGFFFLWPISQEEPHALGRSYEGINEGSKPGMYPAISATIRARAREGKPIIAEKAKERQIRKPESVSQNSVEQKPIDTRNELAAIAKVERIEKDAQKSIRRFRSP